MEEIFKIQIPLSTNDPISQALIYNKDRTVKELFPASAFQNLFSKGEFKIYHYGEVIDGTLNINHRAPYQEW